VEADRHRTRDGDHGEEDQGVGDQGAGPCIASGAVPDWVTGQGGEMSIGAGTPDFAELATIGERLSRHERAALAKRARDAVPLDCHDAWEPVAERNPVALLEQQALERVPELVPIRHGRMLLSRFAYFRGAALPMAADLADTPTSGERVQLCGDAHLSNFGFFGTPERHLFFDVNDFDETAPGPWEWDVKRLAASLEVAGRDNEYTTKERSGIVRRAVRSYRETMRNFAAQSMLDVWYAHLDVDAMLPRFRSLLDPQRTPSVWHSITRAKAHDSMQAFAKLVEVLDGEPRIRYDPPLIIPIEHFVVDADSARISDAIEAIVHAYLETLPPDRQHLLSQYRCVHLARKVVGVGSVGTEAWLVLLLDHDQDAPLFLQIKEAGPSVLERFTTECEFPNYGQRVVVGQRLMQAASDIFLGWDRFVWSGQEHDYYLRQLRDWKGTADVGGMTAQGMDLWGRMCAWTLARAHARSGDRIAIASYLGKSDTFDHAVAAFAATYADQNERDYDLLRDAVACGRFEAAPGV
jgi:uncharacterized protein (DUF2252 family)